MKFSLTKPFFPFVLGMIFSISGSGRVYYVDQLHGDDSGSGKRPQKAWATISKVNEFEFRKGDKILFCGGQTFQGTIKIKNLSGTAKKGVVFSSYGNGKATILGLNSEGLIADSCSFIEIRHLSFIGSGRKTGNTTSGIIIKRGNNIRIDSVEVTGFQKSGVDIRDAENVSITFVYSHNNGFAGILTGEAYYEPFQLLSKNIYIAYCTAENNPGDPTVLDNHSGNGILIGGTDGAVVEYCMAKNNGWDQPWEGNGPIGIWAFHSNNVVIQHCIALSNKTNPKGVDGGGFDFDGGVTNSVMQYNLSYKNQGPGYGLYQYAGAAKWENNIVRYNISFNDGTDVDSCGLQLWNGQEQGPEMKNALIYNNVFFNDFGRAINYKTGDVPGIFYWNNIMVGHQQPIAGEHTKSVFDNNLYWVTENRKIDFAEDVSAIVADPKLKLPNPQELLIEDPSKLKDLEFFKLMSGSPCLNEAKAIPQNGGFDFWGNKLPKESKLLHIGVWQGNER